MSNSGKSFWAKRLKKLGFKVFSCDEMIQKKLGLRGIGDVASWMGQPYEPDYQKNCDLYLKLEEQTLKEIIAYLKKDKSSDKVVVDTTGSVIYTNPKFIRELRELTNVIYLETPQTVQKEMYKLYISNPKPVIWGESFKKRKGESDLDALKRCYPQLLKYRSQKYLDSSHFVLDYFLLRRKDFSTKDFYKYLEGLCTGS